eukprot:gene11840-816_t
MVPSGFYSFPDDGGVSQARGHPNKTSCEAACGSPTPKPSPKPPPKPPPTPKPSGPIVRYHCENKTATCFKVPPLPAEPGGHALLDVCETACYSKTGYVCHTKSNQCRAVKSGGVKLHTCQQNCTGPPTPIPLWTPPPAASRRRRRLRQVRDG